MVPVLPAGEAFFPLDEQLGLLSGGLTPRAEETLVRLATWMPYAQAQELLSDLVGIGVSKTLVLGRSATRSEERSAPSSFPPSRAWLLPSALRKQRWWKSIDEDWNGQQR